VPDPIRLRYTEGNENPWWLSRGRETFFPDDFVPNWKHLRWATKADAIEWCMTTFRVQPEEPAEPEPSQPPPTVIRGQLDLFEGD